MSLVDGEERAAIPSMSWNSVVDETPEPAGATEPDSVDPTPNPSDPTATPTTPSVSFQMTPLGEQTTAETAGEAAPTPPPPPPPISFKMGPPAATSDTDVSPLQSSAGTVPVAPAVEPVSLSIPSVDATAPVAPSVAKAVPAPQPDPVDEAPIVEATSTESPTNAVVAPNIELPTRVVASPTTTSGHHSGPASATIPVDAQPDGPVGAAVPAPAVEAAPVAAVEMAAPVAAVEMAAPAPAVEMAAPAVVPPDTQLNQAAGLSLPPVRVVPVAPQLSQPITDSIALPGEKDRTATIARLGFFLLFVAAVVSVGIIFGRPYLFPAEWDDNALPFAESIEAIRGTEFVEPIRLIAQDNAAHRDLVTEQLIGDAQANMPMWRSLGLAGPDATDDASLRDLTSLQFPVLYSTADGQVYYDQSFNQAHRDQLILRAMTTAALDQEFGFSAEVADRGVDPAALTDAYVLQQAAYVSQLASTTPVTVPEPDVAALAFLPPVLDYRLTAPLVLSDVLQPVNDLAPNPLEEIGSAGPTMTRDTALVVMPTTSVIAGDTPVGSTTAMDRGFWYLVFASHLDPAPAYDMSNIIDRAGLQTVRSADGRTCTVSTFGMLNVADAERLAGSLGIWIDNSAPELGATVVTPTETSVQMRSCDPTGPFTSNARFGISRELIGWRATETAVVGALTAQGADSAAITAALAQIADTPSVQSLIALPAGTAPSEVAASARDAAANVVAAAQG